MYPMNINIFFQLCDCFLLTYQFSNLVLPEQNFHLHQLFQIFLDILLQYAKF